LEKPLIRIVDTQFSHGTSLGSGDLKLYSDHFDWYRGTENINDLVVITEDSFHLIDHFTEKIKIGLIIESPMSNKKSYDFITQPINYNKFDYILTFNKELININPNKFIYYIFGGCWIYPDQRKIYEKNKNISIIASSKRTTVGHLLRHSIISRFNNSIDGIYGKGYKFVENKLEALQDFRYSIIIENDNCDAMFSEKLIDCFMTGTIPVYWGCNSIGDFFNKNGMFCFEKIDELDNILTQCTYEHYNQSLEFIKENFEKAKKYTLPENCMWDTFFKNIIK